MLKKISSYTFVLLGMILLLNSCKKDYEQIESIDDQKIKDYILQNNITNAIEDPARSGYYSQILDPGTGEPYADTDTVLYNITIKSLFNGTVYYSTPATNNLNTFVGYTTDIFGLKIPGIRQAILSLKSGGSARLFLPSHLAFGKNGNTNLNIPSNEIIELVISTFPEKSQRLLDDRKIREYLTEKGLLEEAEKDPSSGVWYVVEQPGTGEEIIDKTSTINANYIGRFIDGTEFETTSEGTFSFTLTGLVANWDVLQGFTSGTKIRLFIPSSEAYGTTGSGVILPNSILDFDIEITNVVN